MIFYSPSTYFQVRHMWNSKFTAGSRIYSKFTSNGLIKKVILSAVFLRGVRLRFKGKTLKAKRISRKEYWFNLGWSHLTESYVNFGVCSKLRNKQRLVFWSYNTKSLNFSTDRFCFLKPTNLYHARGIRKNRTKRLFKDGKVSTYR